MTSRRRPWSTTRSSGRGPGRGGMGIVYQARQRDTGRVVALKVLRKERLGSADLVSRFRREALAAARVTAREHRAGLRGRPRGQHPVHRHGVRSGHHLAEAGRAGGPLPLGQACDFVRQTALGLEHAGERRLVHRDIKPSNLMVVAPAGLPLPPRPVLKSSTWASPGCSSWGSRTPR
ncbi:MAG: hypothetical protein U0797_19605 [Gemmataceae bacterium]